MLVIFALLVAGTAIFNHKPQARGEASAQSSAPVLGYRTIKSYPHDSLAFTQGLLFDGGLLYESTGLRGKSTVRRVRLESGEVIASRSLDSTLFGEGLALHGGRLYQLTWDSGNCFVYDPADLRLTGEFSFPPEGWGLTSDGQSLILSDGTASLRFFDPATFSLRKTLPVTDGGKPIDKLNELEYIENEIYANVWKSDSIARICPKDGHVIAWINLTGIEGQSRSQNPEDVLNGIAWDSSGRRLFVTGKHWNALYEIEIVSSSTGESGSGGCVLKERRKAR